MIDELLKIGNNARMKIKPLPPIEFLNECFDLSHETGRLFWKRERPLHHFKNTHGMRIHNSKWGGKEAGGIIKCSDGALRRIVRLFAKDHFLVHRIIFVMSGEPDPLGKQVDHIDGDPLNNLRSNLRVATNQTNNANVGRKTFMGKERHLPKCVYANGKRFQAKIKVNYRVICLGTFDTPEQASEAYMNAAKIHFGEFAKQD